MYSLEFFEKYLVIKTVLISQVKKNHNMKLQRADPNLFMHTHTHGYTSRSNIHTGMYYFHNPKEKNVSYYEKYRCEVVNLQPGW